eukprot:CAMPEP_0119307178 /NCGR_PEP_ID=MMETSP1333-20130426/7749_1 /TAXON_ID=418940 /ORGANISM="Scyphosphaera apsteinii, Strain RCC1455" /LENGTH=137 /DNA_ID=CAMNT_0007310659 /DNA_START=47 /DNA_END=457 /DNA_ORIENTATION=+
MTVAQTHNHSRETQYEFVPTLLSWSAALAYCLAHGGMLAQINSPEENKKFVLSDPYRKSLTWIGANDMIVEGVWRWVGDGATVNYSNWRPGEPSNSRNRQHCAAIDSEVPSELPNASRGSAEMPVGQWVDHLCSARG